MLYAPKVALKVANITALRLRIAGKILCDFEEGARQPFGRPCRNRISWSRTHRRAVYETANSTNTGPRMALDTGPDTALDTALALAVVAASQQAPRTALCKPGPLGPAECCTMPCLH